MIALYVNAKNLTYFDRFEAKHFPKENRIFIGNKFIVTNIYRIRTYDSIMCGLIC